MKKKQQKFAVVDLEATSASASAKIIQVGIAIVQGGQVIETYETDVNPYESLTSHIVQLTGLTDERLALAPDFSQVARQIYELIHDCIFVAHNVKFDANLLAEELFLEGYELRSPLVDTVELSQILFPTLDRYNLSTLASHLGLDLDHAHTAIDDAKATAQLLIKIQRKLASLPDLTLEMLASFEDQLLFESSLLIEQELASRRFTPPADDQIEVSGLVLKAPRKQQAPRKLSQDFDTNLALLDLDARNEQAAFAQLVDEHFSDSRVSLIEAGTGIGKTYGYLLPLLAKDEVQQVIVAVPTKALQDQLMTGDVKKLADVFHLQATSLKSPQNYISLTKFWQSLQETDSNRLINRFKMQLLVWLCETETGDLDEIQQKYRQEAYFRSIQHDGDLSPSDFFYDVDFWQRHYRDAHHSQIVVTNHAYLLTRADDDKTFIEGKTLVVDEAQKFFLNMENFSRRSILLKQVYKDIQQALDEKPPILVKRLLEGIQFELGQLEKTDSGHSLTSLDQLRLFLSELPSGYLDDLAKVLDHRYEQVWIEVEQLEELRQRYLCSARLDFLSLEDFLPQMQKAYLISATLKISERVSLAELLGISNYRFDSVESGQTMQPLYIDQSMPELDKVSDRRYYFEIADRLAHLQKLNKPMLVLFTATKSMLAVSDILDDRECHHLCQHKNGLASSLKKRFDRGESQLLLGTGSFWEGMDFANQKEIICVITRLPFDNPISAFSQKLDQTLKGKGKNPFNDYELPVTVLRLKQAAGRTKRLENQQSQLILLDKRVLTKSYGGTITTALKASYDVEALEFDKILQKIPEKFSENLI